MERDDVDVVYVATPNSTHAELVSAALAAGKHVLCEKPLAHDGEVATSLFQQAEAAGRILAEAFMYRYHPQTTVLLDTIARGEIGSPRLFRGCYSFPLTGGDDIRLKADLLGGALWDIGAYPVNLARAVFGEPTAVWGSRWNGTSEVDRGFVGILEFRDGCLASFDCSFDLPARRWVEIVGSEGSLRVVNAFMPLRGSIELTCRSRKRHLVTGASNPYVDEARVMTQSVRHGVDETLGREDAIGNARTLAALYQSAAAARPIETGDGSPRR